MKYIFYYCTLYKTLEALEITRKIPKPFRLRDFLFWRSGWDSNPRAVAGKLISSQPRYDHFDTAAADFEWLFPPIMPNYYATGLEKRQGVFYGSAA